MSDSQSPNQEAISQAVIDLISIKDIDEQEKFVTENSDLLVSAAAIEYLSASIEHNTDELAINLLEYHRDLLKDCMSQKIWIAFHTRRWMKQQNSQYRENLLALISQLVSITSYDERFKMVKDNFHLLRDQRSLVMLGVLIRTFTENGTTADANRLKEIRDIILEIQQQHL